MNRELYEEYKSKLYKEFPKVDKHIIETEASRAVQEKEAFNTTKSTIIDITGTIPASEVKEEGYYISHGKIYSLNKARLIYKVNPYEEFYISEKGNYFAVVRVMPDKTGDELLSKNNIKNIAVVNKNDVVRELQANNEILLLATEFPEVFHKMERV